MAPTATERLVVVREEQNDGPEGEWYFEGCGTGVNPPS
jgi:hypothetical protein